MRVNYGCCDNCSCGCVSSGCCPDCMAASNATRLRDSNRAIARSLRATRGRGRAHPVARAPMAVGSGDYYYSMLPGARLEVGPHGQLEESLGACCDGCATGKGCSGPTSTDGFWESLTSTISGAIDGVASLFSDRPAPRRRPPTRVRAVGDVPTNVVRAGLDFSALTALEQAKGLTPAQQAAATSTNYSSLLLLGGAAIGGVLLWKHFRKGKGKSST